jgi:spore cortex formation protein SpoVR/YcgB (stage V sporulation)
MSFSIERVLNEIDQLSLVEQMQVLEHLVDSVTVTQKPKYKVTEFYGIAPNLLGGEDAQVWVNQVRDEWEEREAWRQP